MNEDNDLKATNAAIKIQSLIRGAFTRDRIKRLVKDLFKRAMIIK
jgi:ribonuclease P protein component